MRKGIVGMVVAFYMLIIPLLAVNVNSCTTINSAGTYDLVANLNGADQPTPLGENSCLFINTSNVVLNCNGYSITGTGPSADIGVFIADSENISVNGCYISQYLFGINTYNTTFNISIYNNNITDSRVGIYVRQGSSDVSLYKNNISNTYTGIQFLESSDGNNAYNNSIFNVSYGIYVLNSSANLLENNTINQSANHSSYPLVDSLPSAIVLYNSYDNIANKNELSNFEKGVEIFNLSANNTIALNKIYPISLYGVYILLNSDNNTISSNNISNAVYGAYVLNNSFGNLIENNNISSVTAGVYVVDSNNSNISGNKIVDSSIEGIVLSDANESIVKLNNITTANYGIVAFLSSKNSQLLNNSVSNASLVGIYLKDTSQVSVYYNNITKTSSYALLIKNSTQNTIANNTMEDTLNYSIRMIENSNNNLIENNTATKATIGLWVSTSSSNIFNNNVVCYNIKEDILFDSDATGNTGVGNNGYLTDLDSNSVASTTDACYAISSCGSISNYGRFYLTADLIGLDGANTYCLNAGNDYISIDCSGFSITPIDIGNGQAILIDTKNNITIENCNIREYANGIYSRNSANITLKNNTIDSTSLEGIGLQNITNVRAVLNMISSSEKSGIGIVDNSSNIYLANNSVFGSLEQGIYISNFTNATLENNTLAFNSQNGAFLRIGQIAKITNNFFQNNGNGSTETEGLLLDYVNHSLVEKNNATQNTGSGLEIHNSYNSTFRDNYASLNNENGLTTIISQLINFINNTIENNVQFGISISWTSNSSAILNTLKNNSFAIAVAGNVFPFTTVPAINNTIANNTIINDRTAALAFVGSQLTIAENNTANNTPTAYYFEGATNTSLNNNKIFNTTKLIRLGKDLGYTTNNVTNTTILSLQFNYTATSFSRLDVLVNNTENLTFSIATPPTPPSDFSAYSKALNISGQGEVATLTIYYNESEVTAEGLNESKLELWKHNGTDWIKLPYTLNTTQDKITTQNLNEFSIFALLQNNTIPAPPGGFGGGAEPDKPLKISTDFICPDNTLEVTVTSDGREVRDARVVVKENSIPYIKAEYTDRDGIATFQLPDNGTYKITARKSGYQTAQKTQTIELCQEPQQPQNQTPSNQTPVEEGAIIVSPQPISLIISAPESAEINTPIEVSVLYSNGTPASGVSLVAASDNASYSLETDENGIATYTPEVPGLYTYTASLPIQKTTTTLVEGMVIFQTDLSFRIEETAPIVIKPSIEGPYTAEIYTGNILVTKVDADAGQAIRLTLPKGNYRVVIKSQEKISKVNVEIEKSQVELVEQSQLIYYGLIFLVAALLIILLFFRRRKKEPAKKIE